MFHLHVTCKCQQSYILTGTRVTQSCCGGGSPEPQGPAELLLPKDLAQHSLEWDLSVEGIVICTWEKRKQREQGEEKNPPVSTLRP